MSREEQLQSAIEQFYFSYRAFTTTPDSILLEQGLGRVHHRILYFVGRNSGLNINELLQILSVSKQALNAPLRKLIEKSFIEVAFAEHDRRVKKLNLSKAGKKLEQQLTKSQMQNLEAAFDSAGPKAEQGWRDIMQALFPAKPTVSSPAKGK